MESYFKSIYVHLRFVLHGCTFTDKYSSSQFVSCHILIMIKIINIQTPISLIVLKLCVEKKRVADAHALDFCITAVKGEDECIRFAQCWDYLTQLFPHVTQFMLFRYDNKLKLLLLLAELLSFCSTSILLV